MKYVVDHKYNMDFCNKLSRIKRILIQHVNLGVFDSCDGHSTSILNVGIETIIELFCNPVFLIYGVEETY